MSISLPHTATEKTVTEPGKYTWRQDLRTVRILRLATGATLSMAIAQAIDWPLSYVTAALVVAMLAMPSPPVTYRDTVKNLIYAICAFSFGVVVTLFVLPFPLVFFGVYGLIFFFIHYYLHKGAPFFLILMLVLTTTILPLVGSVDEGLTKYLAFSILWGACLAVVIIQLAYGIFPDPENDEQRVQASFQRGYSPHAAAVALQTTLVVLPAMMVFLSFGWAVHVVGMLYINLVALEGGIAHSEKEAQRYLVANFGGGLAAIVFYCLIVALPAYHFFVALMFFTTLLFAKKSFSDTSTARYYPTALIGLVILISSSTGPGTDMSVVYFKRVLYIALASLYVIASTMVLDRYVFKH